MAIRTISNAGGNWNAVGTWVEGIVPTSADDVVATATSGSVTITAAAACRTIDLTNYVATLTHNASVTLSVHGLLYRLVAGMTYALGSTTTSTTSFLATSGTVLITTAGKTLGGFLVNAPGAVAQLQGSLTQGSTSTLTLTAGTLDTNGHAVSCAALASNNSNVRKLRLGASTITLTGSGTPINFTTSTNLTIEPGTSTIVLSNITASTKTIQGGGKNFNRISLTAGGAGAVIFVGNNTIAHLVINAPKTVTFTSGSTTTLSKTVTATGTAANIITINSSVAATAANIMKSGQNAILRYCSIRDLAVTGAAVYALDSTNVSGNSGIIFSGLPNYGTVIRRRFPAPV